MWISQKTQKYLESETFFFSSNKKNSLITYQGLLHGKKNFLAKVTLKTLKKLVKSYNKKYSDEFYINRYLKTLKITVSSRHFSEVSYLKRFFVIIHQFKTIFINLFVFLNF